jgi:hypothetical protein
MSGQFFIRVDVLQLDNRKTWSFFVVYGPTDHRKSPEFLGELSWAVEACPFPLVLGGDFNLITGSEDKTNTNIYWTRVHAFNGCIAGPTLREIRRGGSRFTCTNKKLNLVRRVLDRVFVFREWETLFPVCLLVAETIIRSDQASLVLSSGENHRKRNPSFFSLRKGG